MKTETARIIETYSGITADYRDGLITSEKRAWLKKKLSEYEAGLISLKKLEDYFDIPF